MTFLTKANTINSFILHQLKLESIELEAIEQEANELEVIEKTEVQWLC
jgi:hypothetical protein